MAKGGLFAALGPVEPEDDAEDYSDDALPIDDEAAEPEIGAGPFEAYCETIFSETSSYEEKCDALRQAMLTVLEERG